MSRGNDDISIDQHILVPHSWRRAISFARVVLASSCLILEAGFSEPSSILIRLLLVLFLVYSFITAFWRGAQRSSYTPLFFAADTLFFLICASIRSDYSVWLCGFYFTYLMVSVGLGESWKHVLVVTVAAPMILAVIRFQAAVILAPAFAVAAIVGLVFAFHRRHLLDRLVRASRQAVISRAESERAREDERERIASDFHDGPQQSFISLQMRLEVLRRLLDRDPEAAKAELRQLQEISRQQVAELRTFVRAMRPIEVDGTGLSASVSRMADTFEQDSKISTSFFSNTDIDVEDAGVARQIIQIVREALHNIQKHSGASRAALGMEKAGSWLELSLQDDGSGFAFAGSYSLEELELLRMGPASIMRRVQGLGGELMLDSRPGFGSNMKIRIPI